LFTDNKYIAEPKGVIAFSISFLDVKEKSITIKWAAVTDGTVENYEVKIATDVAPTTILETKLVSKTTIQVTLTVGPGTKYRVTVSSRVGTAAPYTYGAAATRVQTTRKL
jgi:hypothetical protein